MNYLKNLKWEMMTFSLISIALGILMILFPTKILAVVCTAIASIFFLFGIKNLLEYLKKDTLGQFYQYKLVLAIIFFVIGIVVICCMETILSIITYAIAIVIVVSGLMKVENALDLKKMGAKWIPLMVFAVICIVLGLSVLGMPLNRNDNGTETAGSFFVQCAGGILAFTGLVDVITTMSISGKIKVWKKETYVKDKLEDSKKKDDSDVVDVDYEEVDE